MGKNEQVMTSTTNQPEEENWVTRVKEHRTGTLFFHRIIGTFGIRAAYGMLFLAAWQHALNNKESVRALRTFRSYCGLSCRKVDFFRHFYSFGRSLIDRYVLTRKMRDAEKFRFDFHNESVIASEAAHGSGVILLGAHMGNWEISASFVGRRLSKRVHVFMYDTAGTTTNTVEATANDSVIIHPVQTGGADVAVEIINALRAGEIVCMHGDRFFKRQRTVPVEFFGKKALFPAGPMAMASITGASVIPCFTLWSSPFKYEFSATTPIRPEHGTRERRDAAIEEAMRHYVAILEDRCRQYPLQWYNFHSFWQEDNHLVQYG